MALNMNDGQTGYVSTGSKQLHYRRYGTGPKLLIAFHGYGNEAGIFSPFAPFIGAAYTLYSIDLPHHGNSDWDAGTKLEKADLVRLATNLMKETGADKCSLLGYSIGGRICLSMIEQMPEQIDKVLLIAPDGLVFNPLYYFVTKNFAGKRLFSSFLNNPKKYMRYIDWLKKKNYLSTAQYNFGMNYLGSKEDRNFLLKVWPDLSRIITSAATIKATVIEYHIPVHIFMGAYDRVIPVKNADSFKGIDTVTIHIAEKGHRVFDNDTMPLMAECLLA